MKTKLKTHLKAKGAGWLGLQQGLGVSLL